MHPDHLKVVGQPAKHMMPVHPHRTPCVRNQGNHPDVSPPWWLRIHRHGYSQHCFLRRRFFHSRICTAASCRIPECQSEWHQGKHDRDLQKEIEQIMRRPIALRQGAGQSERNYAQGGAEPGLPQIGSHRNHHQFADEARPQEQFNEHAGDGGAPGYAVDPDAPHQNDAEHEVGEPLRESPTTPGACASPFRRRCLHPWCSPKR